MQSQLRKNLVRFDLEENALFLNLVNENSYKDQKRLISILFQSLLIKPEGFKDAIPFKTMITELHLHQEIIRDVTQALEDMFIVFGQMYPVVQESIDWDNCKNFKIVNCTDRVVTIEYTTEVTEDSDDYYFNN